MLKKLYAAYKINNENINDLQNTINDIIEIQLENDLHITLVYSSNPIDEEKVYNYLLDEFLKFNNPIIKTNKLELFGEYLVLLVNSEQLDKEFNYIIDNFNASWDFESYQPHITLGKINPTDFDKVKNIIIDEIEFQTDNFYIDELREE